MIYLDPIDYIPYIDKLRQQFPVRIQVKNVGYTPEQHDAAREEIISYLRDRLLKEEWAIQPYQGYNGVHYVWFKNDEDAVAFSLKFAGTRL